MADVIEEAAKNETLWQRVKLSVQRLDKDASVIDPVQVADHAFPKLTPELVDFAAVLELRQIAREVLRALHKNGKDHSKDSSKRATEEAPTFSGEDFSLLSVRYPKAHMKGKPQGYVMIDELTEDDWNWNVDWLASQSEKTGAHAFQLERWGIKMKGFRRHDRREEKA